MNLVIRNNVERSRKSSTDDVTEYLILEASDTFYALSISEVEHVFSAKHSGMDRVQSNYTPLLGFLAWNGASTPVLDLQTHLEASASPQASTKVESIRIQTGSIILATHGGTTCGLLVDRIMDITRVASTQLQPYPKGSLACPRRLYRATLVMDHGIAAVLNRPGILSQSVRDFLGTATADYESSAVSNNDD